MAPLSQESEAELEEHKKVLSVLSDPDIKPKLKRELLQTPKGVAFIRKGLPIILLELKQTDLEQYGES